MTILDKFQEWLVEIVGTVVFVITSGILVSDLIGKKLTFSIYIYVVLYIVSLALMGRKGLAKLFSGLLNK